MLKLDHTKKPLVVPPMWCVVWLYWLQDDMDLKALGFDIAEGVNDPYLPGDCGIFVSRVDKGSIADGRLRWEFVPEHSYTLANKQAIVCQITNYHCDSFLLQGERLAVED